MEHEELIGKASENFTEWFDGKLTVNEEKVFDALKEKLSGSLEDIQSLTEADELNARITELLDFIDQARTKFYKQMTGEEMDWDRYADLNPDY